MSNVTAGFQSPISTTDNPYGLTLLERQVVELLIDGLSEAQVSDELGLDRRDVALRHGSAMRKFGARNGRHLAHLVATIRSEPKDDGIVILEDVPSAFAF